MDRTTRKILNAVSIYVQVRARAQLSRSIWNNEFVVINGCDAEKILVIAFSPALSFAKPATSDGLIRNQSNLL